MSHQIETAELADAELDAVSGGATSPLGGIDGEVGAPSPVSNQWPDAIVKGEWPSPSEFYSY